MSLPVAVVLATLTGLLVGALARRWLAVLPRGAVLRAGWIELPSGLLGGLGTALTWADGSLLTVLWIGLLAVPLTAVDLIHHRLPDALTLPAIPITVGVVALDALRGHGSLLRAVVAGVVVGGLFYALVLLAPRAMGRGDAKLAFTVGLALGAQSVAAVVLGVFLAFAFGSLVGLVGIATRRLALRSSIAFGPSMLLGCWLVCAVPQLTAMVTARPG